MVPGRRRLKNLALCLQPVVQRVAGLPASQLEQAVSLGANEFNRAIGRVAAFTDFMLNLP